MASYPSTFVAYTGASPDAPLIGGQDPVSQRQLEVLWVGSTLGMAQQFQDGEIRKLRVHLQHPLVLDEESRQEQFDNLSHARIVERLHEQVQAGQAPWDGVIFLDTVDGMEVSDVVAIFPRFDENYQPSVSHAVEVIGKTTFDNDLDDWISTPGFSFTKNFEPADPPWEDATIAANGLSVRDNFEQWFEGSQILNDLGRPQMVFHGTCSSFDEFESGSYQAGYFFSHDPDYALERAIDDSQTPGENQENLVPVYLDMKAPLDVRLGLSAQDLKLLIEAGADPEILEYLEKYSDQYMVFMTDIEGGGDEFIEVCRAAGFDGLIFNETFSDTDPLFAYAVFSPTQIKSAISNSGLYVQDSCSLTDRDAALTLKSANDAKFAIETMSAANSNEFKSKKVAP